MHCWLASEPQRAWGVLSPFLCLSRYILHQPASCSAPRRLTSADCLCQRLCLEHRRSSHSENTCKVEALAKDLPKEEEFNLVLMPRFSPIQAGIPQWKVSVFLPLFLSEPGVVTGTSCCELQRVTLQFSSVAQSCLTLCDPMDCSTPGLPVHHQLLEFTQTHVHRVCDTIQLSYPLSFPSPPAFNLSQHRVFSNWSFLCVRWPKY